MIFHFREENQENFFFQRTALVGAVADRLLRSSLVVDIQVFEKREVLRDELK